MHRGTFYPGTGAVTEVGLGAGEGFSVNVPWPCGDMRNGDYLAAFAHVVLPVAYGEDGGGGCGEGALARACPSPSPISHPSRLPTAFTLSSLSPRPPAPQSLLPT